MKSILRTSYTSWFLLCILISANLLKSVKPIKTNLLNRFNLMTKITKILIIISQFVLFNGASLQDQKNIKRNWQQVKKGYQSFFMGYEDCVKGTFTEKCKAGQRRGLKRIKNEKELDRWRKLDKYRVSYFYTVSFQPIII